jgi:CubicO group peptidase (beta-lactamase class C family)
LAAWGQAAPSLSPALADRIDQIAREQIHDGRTPGLAVGVVQDGRLVYARGFGFATTGPRHAAMTPGTEFYVGGLTKEFTAAAILLLAQDGKLKLTDPVSKYLPAFKLGANVTIGQLLTQTSGLPNYTAAPGLSTDPTRSVKLAEVLAAVDKMKPVAPPGSAYAENPLNYLLAGTIVERVSGVPLSDYLEQHIFIPLVMNHTFLAGDNGISPSHATGYTRANNSFRTAPTWDPAWLAGDAGLVTTIDDLAKWDVEMPVLLRVDAVRTIFTPNASQGATHYGMGWVVDRRGGKDFVWSNGEISGYRAMNALIPDDHVAVIVFSNADSLHGGTTTPEAVGSRILDVLAPPASAQLDNAVVTLAKEWLGRLATRDLDRSELTPAFSSYLTDELVARENFASLGRLQTIVPLSSTRLSDGDVRYVFLVGYPHGAYHYEFKVAPDGKIDGITLVA